MYALLAILKLPSFNDHHSITIIGPDKSTMPMVQCWQLEVMTGRLSSTMQTPTKKFKQLKEIVMSRPSPSLPMTVELSLDVLMTPRHPSTIPHEEVTSINDVDSGKELFTIKRDCAVMTVAFSP